LLGCEEISGSLTANVFEDTDLAPLAQLRAVGGSLIIGGLPELGNFDEEALAAYQAELERLDQIIADGWLSTLHGVEALERVGSLSLLGIGTSDLTGFESLQTISAHRDGARAGSLTIANTRLEDLSGLEGVSGVGAIDIETSPALVSLDGLNVGDTLDLVQLRDVPALSDASALSEVETIQLAAIIWNTGLENMDDFASLSVTGNASLGSVSINVPNLFKASLVQNDFVELSIDVIEIGDNPRLESLSVDTGVTAAQVLAVYSNTNLASIDLGTVRRLDRLLILGNLALESVALGDLETVDSIAVHENPGLSTAELRGVPTFEGAFSGNAD
jgi:hypothetical protein